MIISILAIFISAYKPYPALQNTTLSTTEKCLFSLSVVHIFVVVSFYLQLELHVRKRLD